MDAWSPQREALSHLHKARRSSFPTFPLFPTPPRLYALVSSLSVLSCGGSRADYSAQCRAFSSFHALEMVSRHFNLHIRATNYSLPKANVMPDTKLSSYTVDKAFDIDDSAAVMSDEPDKIYEEYEYLRKRCPLIHTRQYGGYWLMTRYEDIKCAAMDSQTYISSVKAVVPSDPRGLRRPPLNFDPPAHTPFRTALERTVKPVRLNRLKQPLREHAEAELAPLLSRGFGDISAKFAANFVARMECEWLNLDAATASDLAKTAAGWLNAWRMQQKDVVTFNSQKMYRIAEDLLADRRLNPREPEDDPASSLLLERDMHGKPLRNEDLM